MPAAAGPRQQEAETVSSASPIRIKVFSSLLRTAGAWRGLRRGAAWTFEENTARPLCRRAWSGVGRRQSQPAGLTRDRGESIAVPRLEMGRTPIMMRPSRCRGGDRGFGPRSGNSHALLGDQRIPLLREIREIDPICGCTSWAIGSAAASSRLQRWGVAAANRCRRRA